MYIAQRLSSLSLFVGCLACALFLLSIVKQKLCFWVLGGYLIVLTLFAYFFKPNMLDLFRLQEMCLRSWCYYSWGNLQELLKVSAVPMWHLFSWSIFHFTHDLDYIQAVACFWCFGNVFYVIQDLIVRYKLRGIYRACLLFSVMAIGSFYMQTICDIRNMLSFSICFWCMYREMMEDKSVLAHVPLYICAALFHPAGLVLVVGRMLALVPWQKTILRKILLSCIVAAAVFYLLQRENLFLNFAQEKANTYSFNSSEFRSWRETFIGLLELVQIFYVLLCYRIYTRFNHRDVWGFSAVLFLACVAAVFVSYAIFRRYTILCSLLVLPLAAQLLSIDSKKERKDFTLIFSLLSTALFLFSYTAGDMRFYQFLM